MVLFWEIEPMKWAQINDRSVEMANYVARVDNVPISHEEFG